MSAGQVASVVGPVGSVVESSDGSVVSSGSVPGSISTHSPASQAWPTGQGLSSEQSVAVEVSEVPEQAIRARVKMIVVQVFMVFPPESQKRCNGNVITMFYDQNKSILEPTVCFVSNASLTPCCVILFACRRVRNSIEKCTFVAVRYFTFS